ncbi:MAG TPA: GTP-binding protein, partial [Burkholderiaceae bacterium]
RRWRDGEAQRTRLVFIGEDLDEGALRKALEEASAVAAA